MKKNTMMRLASCLLIAVLMTTCVISGTFAKYVTDDTNTDSARVAKWGVGVTVTAGETKATAFDEGDAYTSANGTTVLSSNGTDKILAPGTDGTLLKVAITGAPEVTVDIKADVDVEISDNWKVDEDTYYFPIVVEVNDTPVTYAVTGDAATIEVAIEDAIIKAILEDADATTNTLATGKTATKRVDAASPSADLASTVNVTWAWDFDAEGVGTNDANDTILGNSAAEGENLNFAITATVTVTQVD